MASEAAPELYRIHALWIQPSKQLLEVKVNKFKLLKKGFRIALIQLVFDFCRFIFPFVYKFIVNIFQDETG